VCGKRYGGCGVWGWEDINPPHIHKPNLIIDKRYKDISKNGKSFDRGFYQKMIKTLARVFIKK
jgi:hypothetical protein